VAEDVRLLVGDEPIAITQISFSARKNATPVLPQNADLVIRVYSGQVGCEPLTAIAIEDLGQQLPANGAGALPDGFPVNPPAPVPSGAEVRWIEVEWRQAVPGPANAGLGPLLPGRVNGVRFHSFGFAAWTSPGDGPLVGGTDRGVLVDTSANGVFEPGEVVLAANPARVHLDLEVRATTALALVCDGLDFNNDCLFPDSADAVAFVDVFAGGTCATWKHVDFNNDGVFPDVTDVAAFLNTVA
jgi:hypothetical protein